MASVVAEIVWLNGLLNELGFKSIEPTTLFCDNIAAIQIANTPVFHERTKQIEIDCHFVREKIQKGLLRTEHVSTKEQLVDVLTKRLGVHQHELLVTKLRMRDLFNPPT